jgi:CobQ-like glutamine amidotransferase family enzyme
MKISLLHLFADELSSSGDSGNVQAVAYRLGQSGYETEIVHWNGSFEFPSNVDAVFIGNGPWSAAATLLPRLLEVQRELFALRDVGVPIFAVGVGAELLATHITTVDGTAHSGVNIFPFEVQREYDRRVGYMRVSSTYGDLIGFGDFASRWVGTSDSTPLGKAVVGDRPGEVFSEGFVVNNSLATRLGGPAIALNPSLALSVISSISDRRGMQIPMRGLAIDEYAANARDLVVKNLDSVFTTIAL